MAGFSMLNLEDVYDDNVHLYDFGYQNEVPRLTFEEEGPQEVLEIPTNIDVKFEDVKSEYVKKQHKSLKRDLILLEKKSGQLILEGKVHFLVSSSISLDSFGILAFVRRTPESAQAMTEASTADINGEFSDEAQLKVNILERNATLGQVRCEVDLGSTYYTNNHDEVFKLSPTRMPERNKFEILVSIMVSGEDINRLYNSEPFLVKSLERPKKSKSSNGESSSCSSRKRRANDYRPLEEDSRHSEQSINSADIRPLPSIGYSSGTESSPGSSGNFMSAEPSPGSSDNFTLHIDNLAAEKAFIKELEFVKCITRDKGDIGYHIRLGETGINREWKEGTVVAFVPGQFGGTTLEELSPKNMKHARLAGVITRSAYFESKILTQGQEQNQGQTHEQGASDVVCVMGVVNVNIIGSIRNGEPVYASSVSGTGISKSNLQLMRYYEEDNHIMLGQSLETKKAPSNNEIHQVKCLVSLLLGIQSREMMHIMRDAKEKSKAQIHQTVNREKKKITRNTIIGVISSVIFLILLGVMLREFVSRSTAFQYYLCKRGMSSAPPACLKFRSPLSNETRRVKGYEFEWKTLKKKLGLDLDSLEVTLGNPKEKYRYFLNVDRCAYTRLWFRNKGDMNVLVLHGTEVFAVPRSKGKKELYHIEDNEWENIEKRVKLKRPC